MNLYPFLGTAFVSIILTVIVALIIIYLVRRHKHAQDQTSNCSGCCGECLFAGKCDQMNN